MFATVKTLVGETKMGLDMIHDVLSSSGNLSTLQALETTLICLSELI